MNQLTRCGLLPSAPECTSYITPNKKLPVHFGDNIIVPAPFAFRPFAQYYNPYSRGCSVLCNHPVDEETKQQASLHNLKKHTERRYRIVIENESGGNENWQNDIFVPEALFRRYTETDSRPPSPTATSAITNLSPKILVPQSRRCVTPDANIHVPEKTQLILDLRKTSSQTALDDNSQYLADRNLLMPWSVNSTNKDDKSKKTNFTSNKSASKTLDTFATEKNKMRKQMCGQKETAKMTSTTLVKGTNSSPVVKALQEKKKKPVKRLKSKKKDSKRSSSAAEKNGVDNNLREPNETQVSTLDDGSGVTTNNVTPVALDQVFTECDRCEDDEIKRDPNLDLTSYLEKHLIKRLRTEFNCETLNSDLDEKHLKIFEEMMSKLASVFPRPRSQDTSSDVEYEIKKLQREFRLNSVIQTTESFTNVAGVFSRRNARFELPMDRMCLEQITTLQYLKTYVHITKQRLWIYNRVFEMYSDGEEYMKVQKLFRALIGIIGREFTQEEENLCSDLFERVSDVTQMDFQTWCGICAFCERIFCTGNAFNDLAEDPRYEMEIADFEYLDRKIRNLNISQQLKETLFMIRSS